jgi:hypothetical protein
MRAQYRLEAKGGRMLTKILVVYSSALTTLLATVMLANVIGASSSGMTRRE